MRAFLCKPNFCDDIKRWVLHYEHQISIFLLVLLSNLFGLCQLICNVQTDRSSRWLPATASVCRYRRPMGKRFFVGSRGSGCLHSKDLDKSLRVGFGAIFGESGRSSSCVRNEGRSKLGQKVEWFYRRRHRGSCRRRHGCGYRIFIR